MNTWCWSFQLSWKFHNCHNPQAVLFISRWTFFHSEVANPCITLLFWSDSFRLSYSLPLCHPQICSGASCFHGLDNFSPSLGASSAPLCISRARLSSVRTPFSAWRSPGYFPSIVSSLHRCWVINQALVCNISHTALGCYLSLVHAFTFLAFMSYLFKFPWRAQSISLACSPLTCALCVCIAAL